MRFSTPCALILENSLDQGSIRLEHEILIRKASISCEPTSSLCRIFYYHLRYVRSLAIFITRIISLPFLILGLFYETDVGVSECSYDPEFVVAELPKGLPDAHDCCWL